MISTIRQIFAGDVLLNMSLLLFGGYLLGKLAERIKLPAISGYIIAGLIMGESVTGIINHDILSHFHVITQVALGLVALTIGGEFEKHKLYRLGKSIIIITVCEVLFAFIFIFIAMSIYGMAVRVALLYAAIGAATAPAATVVIIQNLRARGEFVDTIYGIVALDDAGGVILFAGAFAFFAGTLNAGNTLSPFALIGHAFFDIGLSLGIGFILGMLLNLFTFRNRSTNEMLILALATVFVVIAICNRLEISPLLANMMVGIVVVNFSRKGERVLKSVGPMTPPIYAAFFTIAGTELNLDLKGGSAILIMGFIYVAARGMGKYLGVRTGSTIVGLSKRVRKYLGLCMLPQAGVAIGLAMSLQTSPVVSGVAPETGMMLSQMVNVVLFTVLVNELIGPPLSKIGILKGANL